MLGAMAGHDPKDSTSMNLPVPDYEAALGGDLKGMRIGVPKEYRIDGTPDDIEALWDEGVDWLKAAGAEVVPCLRVAQNVHLADTPALPPPRFRHFVFLVLAHAVSGRARCSESPT